MESHCSSCENAAQQLTIFLKTRRDGQSFQTSNDLDKMLILALFGTVGEISRRKGCPSCRDLEQEFARWGTVYQWTLTDDMVVGIEISGISWESRAKPPPQPLYLFTKDITKGGGEYHMINFLPLERGAPHDTCGRLIDRYEMDFGLVKHWLQCCDLTHGEYCTSGLTERLPPNARPPHILLVDLENHCLAYGTLESKYVALSYVWGQVNNLRTTRANLEELSNHGSLKFLSRDSKIPETISDFMKIVGRLGIRYAWVDSLCIVQDGDDLQQQLNGMATIFASAYLTIVSEGPDANFGLIGAGSGGKPRDRPCYNLRLPEMTCVFTDNFIPPNNPMIWESRAWTFQEGLFSRRILSFDIFGILGWKCSRCFWNETQEEPSEALDWTTKYPRHKVRDWRYLGFSDINFSWPDMRRWCELVEEYTHRELSFGSDGLNAVAGLISVVESASPGGFFYGIPELFFDSFLLWDIAESYIAERREVKSLPSWSFLGWKGGQPTRLDLFWWRFSMDHTFLDQPDEGFGSDCEIGSIVDWYKEGDSCKLIPIANHFHVFRSQGIDKLPSGWTKHDSEEHSRVYYTYESIDNCPHFRYPIALPHAQTRLDNTVFGHYLKFTTRRGWLNIGNPVPPTLDHESTEELKFKDRSAINLSLLSDSGNWAGIIRLPLKQASGSSVPVDTAQKGEPIELIAVAAGKVRNNAFPKYSVIGGQYRLNIPEWNCEDRPQDEEFYRFYFVLCLEWKEGIAYRKGLGRVEKKAWEQLRLEDIDVILG